MRRIALLASVAALGVAVAALAQPAFPPLKARLVTCQTGADAADRYAIFTGSMPAQPGARTLAMRFELLERQAGSRAFSLVHLPRWGVWERTTRGGVPGFIFTKRVEQLAAPAAFRARLTFRWRDRNGDVLRTAHRTSGVCRQPDPRPDLHVVAVDLPASGPATVVVRNRGRSAAGAFAVRMSRAGATATRQVAGLAAGDHETLSFPLGRCVSGEPVAVVVDAGDQVDEAREGDDTMTVTCPAP